MRRIVAALVCLLTLVPRASLGGGIGLSWDDCALAPTPQIKLFACDRNTGFDTLVGSFEPDYEWSDVIGIEAEIGLVFREGYVPSWWQMGPGGCRLPGGLTVNGTFSEQQTACVDPWQSQASGGLVFVTPSYGGNPARLMIRLSMGLPLSAPASVAPGTIYYAYQLQFRRGSTVGSGACSGCDHPAILLPLSIRLMTLNSGVQEITSSLEDGRYACWQCDCGIGSQDYFFGFCAVTGIPNRTWGGIKSLYR